ncbi:MAG: glutamate synthase large subunit [Chloroflexota bacterium]
MADRSSTESATVRRRPAARRPTLDDPRFEHDACGVGFVADAGGRSRSRVLPLALAGLAALRHRGAVAADGTSSDGAGVLLPLEHDLLDELVGPLASGRPAIIQLFLPAPARALARARRLIRTSIEAEGLAFLGWREVPVEWTFLGRAAAESSPVFAQAIVARPGGTDARRSDDAFERRLVVLRRQIETAARSAGLGELHVASLSGRTIVYKGLVSGDRLADLYPDLRAPVALSHAIFHQRFATNTRPVWQLAQPFRSIAHNGEINTVRGNREQVRGRFADRLGGPSATLARRLLAAGPLLSSDGSDSLSLDEALELLTTTGFSLPMALLATIPEAAALRSGPHPRLESFRRRTASLVAPWDGPAAIVFSDGRRVGALLDRNGLRPLAYAITEDRLVAAASEAGAVPLAANETVRRERLGPGGMLLVDPRRGTIMVDGEAKTAVLGRLPIHDAPRVAHEDRSPDESPSQTPAPIRYLAGVDAERVRLDIRTMTLDGHEPLWSMGDDTPTPGRGRLDHRVADHLRQSFAQVTNPPIDPDRERIVMDLRVELGRRPPLLGGPPRRPGTVRMARPVVADVEGLLAAADRGAGSVRILDATWSATAGPAGLELAVHRLAGAAVAAARGRTSVLVISDRRIGTNRLPIPSPLAVGAIHTALTHAGLRGRTDIVAAVADVLDVHGLAMVLACGATAVHPWLAIELATEFAGGRGAEDLTSQRAVDNLLSAFETGLRKTLARMGISSVASYVGGALFEALELAPDVLDRCFPAAVAWPGRLGFAALAARQLRRRDAALALPEPPAGREPRLPDPGLARFRADGEAHLYAPRIVAAIQALAGFDGADFEGARTIDPPVYRAALSRQPAVARDDLRLRSVSPIPRDDVEPARAIAARFVVSAMSVGALSPEAHQALTVGIQRAGGAANTGEGGEDPAWYEPAADGSRRDARIKQIASARFGVTAEYLARADQLEIKMAQGSKPGEGGQLPGRKATAYIAALRRAQPGQSLISPPPHHDIYSIEDLAQLISDLRAINPTARIGVKLVATRGVGTIAAGVVKAGANYLHLSGHAGGTGASPLSSIKHAGAPWEFGLAEIHQVLLRNDLRDRVALRVDGGLQTGRDLLMAALLGAEEFAFGTAGLVAIGCDMARQCHLDTCPTGIATQREDLRAKFKGTPEQVERFFLGLAEDFRHELAGVGARSVGEVIGEARRHLGHVARGATHDLRALVGTPRWNTSSVRRARPGDAGRGVARPPSSLLESRLIGALAGQGGVSAGGLVVTTADRSFGAGLTGAIERGEIHRPISIGLQGSAGQSFGAFATRGLRLHLTGQANDFVGKGLSGGTIVVTPEEDLAADEHEAVIAGNTCLYGATAGRLHVIGRAAMRFAVRNSGADAVVEGLGPHGCEYMTGGIVVVLGPVGPNFGAGMTGGRAYVYDPNERPIDGLSAASVQATRLSTAVRERSDSAVYFADLKRLVEAHASEGSLVARSLGVPDPADFWLVEPIGVGTALAIDSGEPVVVAKVPAVEFERRVVA